MPDELEASSSRSPTPTTATSRCSSRCPTAGPIDQLFPIMPIHRLDEEPTRRAMLADLTCDTDGKIDHFIDLHDVKHSLELHPFARVALLPGHVPGRRLPGDPGRPAQPVRRHQRCPRPLTRREGYTLEHVVKGDSVAEVLRYVQYSEGRSSRGSGARRSAPRDKRITLAEQRLLLRHYERSLAGYTYLWSDQ